MKTLTVNQLEQVSGGNWSAELLCGMGLGSLMGYSLSFAAIPGGQLPALGVCLCTTLIVGISCHGWFGE